MKTSPRDERFHILITGRELEELQRFTGDMVEAFGLDRRIENYKGTRPIGFYRWDLDCLVDVTAMALDDDEEYPEKSGPAYEAMKQVHERIVALQARAYGKDEDG